MLLLYSLQIGAFYRLLCHCCQLKDGFVISVITVYFKDEYICLGVYFKVTVMPLNIYI